MKIINLFGRYLDSSNLHKRFKRILKSNNIKDRKFHDLRHTYATRLFELGEDPKTVQTLLGHSNISITLDTYTHVLDSMKERAGQKFILDKTKTSQTYHLQGFNGTPNRI